MKQWAPWLLLMLPFVAFAQTNPAAQAAREWREQHERAIVDELVELLKIPNVSRDRANIERNAELLVEMMQRRGIAVRLAVVDGANPVVFGEIQSAGARRTIGLYAHYDGQPLDPAEWTTPAFEPTLRSAPLADGGAIIPLPPPGTAFDPEWRLYARSAGDDKVPIIAMLAALDAIRAAGLELNSNVKFMLDGEEEMGSPNLARILAANRELFAADVWLVCDGPMHQTRRPLVYFGVRDSVGLDLTVYGAKLELHSGHYGGWTLNPAMLLARLLASMQDENGRVLVEGFYDGVEPLSETERGALEAAPDIDAELMHELWLGGTEGAPRSLVELMTEPALNVRGLASSRIGDQASNVIPSTATASIDIRIVKGMDGAVTQERVVEHIRQQGFFVVDEPPDRETRQQHSPVIWVERRSPGLGAVRTPMDLPISQEVIGAVESVLGPPVKLPNMGGSLPLADIESSLGSRTIIVPIANHDNNQHSFDENLRIQNLWDGIELMAALLTL
jgi:acetylornithine deacetylase/succinyl-diaminopimelate desuccinylase-like protein